MTLPSGDGPVAVLGGGPAAVPLLGELAALAGVTLALGELDADEVPVAVDAVDALETIELASLGEMVVVVALADADAELFPELVRTSWPSMSD